MTGTKCYLFTCRCTHLFLCLGLLRECRVTEASERNGEACRQTKYTGIAGWDEKGEIGLPSGVLRRLLTRSPRRAHGERRSCDFGFSGGTSSRAGSGRACARVWRTRPRGSLSPSPLVAAKAPTIASVSWCPVAWRMQTLRRLN